MIVLATYAVFKTCIKNVWSGEGAHDKRGSPDSFHGCELDGFEADTEERELLLQAIALLLEGTEEKDTNKIGDGTEEVEDKEELLRQAIASLLSD